MDKLPSTWTVFWDFSTVMKQKRLYHFMDLKYIWYIKMKKNECKNLYFPTLLLMYICLNGQFTFNIYYFFFRFSNCDETLYHFKNCRYNIQVKKKWIFLSFRIFCRFVYFVILFRYIITLCIVEKSYFSSFKVIW